MHTDVGEILITHTNLLVNCDYQQQYKSIIKSAMVCTNEELTNNSSIYVRTSENINNTIARNSLSQFSELLNDKQQTAYYY